MSRRMLIDGTHSEEVCVVVMDGKRLEEYDVETSTKRQLKGNVYLAKVTRVEPSLQAAFVDFGGNRHGFLAFNEIHPDYYQIPIADREALLAEQEELELDAPAAQEHVDEIDGGVDDAAEEDAEAAGEDAGDEAAEDDGDGDDEAAIEAAPDEGDGQEAAADDDAAEDDAEDTAAEAAAETEEDGSDAEGEAVAETADESEAGHMAEAASTKETATKRRRRPVRRYKIQEVIRRRQVLLVQVVKEERGNKGAALTTYVSLAGRYCVLMPNTSRGGGISRKITNQVSRRKLKDIHGDLDIPQGMGVILRTAGMERNKSEIKRDFEYLIRAWDEVRELTLRSSAPTLVYEEASLIKRAIRDLYDREMEDVLVEGTEAYQTAKKFMRLLMPSHAKKVQPYREPAIPLFQRYQVESQLDEIHVPEVKLPSGGSIVIHTTEALVAVDVNSGKSTRERNIEETAVKTNLEAAQETARQLRLRDLAGLVVIDFIDMEERRHIRSVEKRLKDSMKVDRARIQLGRISNFGLLELSRQRLRPSLIEASTEICKHCKGTGFVRSTESTAVRVLRAIEEEGVRQRSTSITVGVPTMVALYMLNQKRDALAGIELRYGFRVFIAGDDSIIPPDMWIERVKGKPEANPASAAISIEDIVAEDISDDEAAAEAEAASDEEDVPEEGPRRRTRRRRGRRRDSEPAATEATTEVATEAADDAAETTDETETEGEGEGEEKRRPRRRRSRRSTEEPAIAADAADAADEDTAGETAEASSEDEAEPRTRRKRRGRRGGRNRNRSQSTDTESTVEAAEQPDLDAAPPEWVGAAEAPADSDGAAPNGSDNGEPAGIMAPEEEPVEISAEISAPEEEPAELLIAHATADAAPDDDAPSIDADHDAGDDDAGDDDAGDADDDAADDDAETEALTESAAAADAASSNKSGGPKRRGWWRRVAE